MPQIYDMGPTALLPFRRKACWGIFRPEKSWRFRSGLNPRTWVLKGSTQPLDHRSMNGLALNWICYKQGLLTSYIVESALKDGLLIICAFSETFYFIWKQIFGRCAVDRHVQWRITNTGPNRFNVMGDESRPQPFSNAEGLISNYCPERKGF